MVLNMTHVVKEQFGEGDLDGAVRTKLSGRFMGQALDDGSALLAAVIEVGEQLVLRVGAIGVDARGVEFAQGEGGGRSEAFRGIGEGEVEIEERVISRVPEAGAGP